MVNVQILVRQCDVCGIPETDSELRRIELIVDDVRYEPDLCVEHIAPVAALVAVLEPAPLRPGRAGANRRMVAALEAIPLRSNG